MIDNLGGMDSQQMNGMPHCSNKVYSDNKICVNKAQIEAESLTKTTIFNVNNDINIHLSRVDSQNYPDATTNLDIIANKMGFKPTNSQPKDHRLHNDPVVKSHSLNEVNAVMEESMESNKKQKRKKGITNDFLRRFSKSKNKRIDKDQTQIDKNLNSDKNATPIATGKASSLPKSIRKIIDKFSKKKSKLKYSLTSDPASDIVSGSRRSFSSALQADQLKPGGAASCNDISTDNLSTNDTRSIGVTSECCLDVQRINGSNSSISGNLFEKEVKTYIENCKTTLSQDTISPEKSNDSQFNQDCVTPLSVNIPSLPFGYPRSSHSTSHSDSSGNIKLTLALHGYGRPYGLRSSKLTSKSCMEFRSASIISNTKSSADNILENSVQKDSVPHNDVNLIVEDKETENKEDLTDSTKVDDDIDKFVAELREQVNETHQETMVTLRKERPTDIQLRKSRTISQTSVTRASLIMLTVAHNSPRNKTASNQFTTPVKTPDFSSSWSGGDLNNTTNRLESPTILSTKKLNFDEYSYDQTTQDSDNKMNNLCLESQQMEIVKDGNYFLEEVNKCEMELLLKINEFQQYLDADDLHLIDEVKDNLRCVIGKGKLLITEKFNQFKDLCNQNLNEIVEDGYVTLSSDLDGFWTMVLIQVGQIREWFKEIEKIKDNNWTIPQLVEEEQPKSSVKTVKKKAVGRLSNVSKTPVDVERTKAARQRLDAFKKIAKDKLNTSVQNGNESVDNVDFIMIK